MAKINLNYKKLVAGYLFPEISRRTNAPLQENPDADIECLGIGNTTEPLSTHFHCPSNILNTLIKLQFSVDLSMYPFSRQNDGTVYIQQLEDFLRGEYR